MQSYMASDGNLKEHEQTYSGFTVLLKWGTIFSLVAAAIVVLIISR